MKKIAIVALAVAALAGCSKNPEEPAASRPAPENFRVKFDTSKGPFTIEVTRAMAPLGADRFYDLVQQNFFDDARFFRVLKGFVVQFGINKNPVEVPRTLFDLTILACECPCFAAIVADV